MIRGVLRELYSDKEWFGDIDSVVDEATFDIIFTDMVSISGSDGHIEYFPLSAVSIRPTNVCPKDAINLVANEQGQA